MPFQKTKIARSIGAILVASFFVFPAFADPPSANSQKPYCLQPAQKDAFLKSFKINDEQLKFLLTKGGMWDAFNTATPDGNGKYPISENGWPITGAAYCRAALGFSIDSDFKAFQNFIDKCINPEKEAQSKGLSQSKQNRIEFDSELGDWESSLQSDSQKLEEIKAQAALSIAKEPLSCETAKKSSESVLGKTVSEAIILPQNPASGLHQSQKKILQGTVGAALKKATNPFGTNGSGATPVPPSGGMGNLTQTQGQTPQNSGAGSSGATKASPSENPQNSDQLPLLRKTETPPTTPPAPDKPKKSKPGFFAKIWNGIKKVAHYIATSRIGTGLLLGAAAALMVTGFGAAPGVIIAAAVLGAGIGLAAGPLTNSSPSKALPPPPPIASSPTNSNNPSPAPTTPAQSPSATATPQGKDTNIDSSRTMDKAKAIANQLNQNKPTEDETGSGLPPSAAVTPRNTNQNSLASNKPIPAHKNIPKASSPYHKKPSAPSKKSVEAPKAGISVTKSAGYGAIVGGSAGLGLAAAGIISSPLWASAAIGVAAGAAVAAAGAAAWNYFKNKPTPAKPKVKPQKNQNAGDAPKTQALPKPPILGPQEM